MIRNASRQGVKNHGDLFTAMAGDDVDEDVADAAPTNPEDEDEEVQRTSVFPVSYTHLTLPTSDLV